MTDHTSSNQERDLQTMEQYAAQLARDQLSLKDLLEQFGKLRPGVRRAILLDLGRCAPEPRLDDADDKGQ